MSEQPEALRLADALRNIAADASISDRYCEVIFKVDDELRRLHAVNAELLEALRNMVEMFKDVPTLEQNSFDEPPEPKTQWDYEAYLMIGAARAAIAKAEEA